MPNIVLTRIDNRLVHGQVATQWCGAIGANLILVANDEVAGNKRLQELGVELEIRRVPTEHAENIEKLFK